ncbi:MAG: hypothetical protein HC876_06940 [Chloroflexaceae bacterium]|nr:hypothetical protein [Chloroflexaceae bacterium]
MPISSAPQTVQITCPNCRQPYQTQVFSLVDVTQHPELKRALMAGQINVAVCPNCGFVSMLGTPLAYHDAAKQLFLVYIPSELGLPAEMQERFIGDVTTLSMQSLPEQASKSHLLTPRRFLSMASLIDAVLDAEGISKEVREQQRRVVELISQLAEALPDQAGFKQLVDANRAAFNEEFFGMLGAYIQASAREQRSETAQVLALLQQRLAEVLGIDLEAGDEMDSETGGDELELNEVLQRIEEAPDERLAAELAEVRPYLDYSFFQAWTTRIEALQQEGDTAAAERLTQRRQQILELVEQMDREAQAMFEAGATTLEEVLQADDTRAALQGLGDRLDEAFMMVLSANIAAAERTGQSEVAARLQALGQLAFEVLQENMTPEERLINELLAAETPRDSQRTLRNNAALVTPEFVTQLNELADDQEQRGTQAIAEQLRRLAREASAMLF